MANPSRSPGQPRRASVVPVEPLEQRLHWSVSQDANGWTVVTPSSNSKIIYVSSSQGNDNNSGLSPLAPVYSFAKAQSLMVSGQPDEILLKSGDTFSDSFQNWNASGESVQMPAVISYYGSGPRPLIYTGSAGTGFATSTYANSGTVVNYLDVIGLQFEANLRDPTIGTVNTSFAGEDAGFEFYANGGNVLVEDCSFNYYLDDFNIEGIGGSYYTNASVSNITIRRCVVDNSYAFNSGHSQGLYAFNVSNLSILQSTFDHDGWNTASYLGATDLGFNHDIYIASTCSGIDIEQNVLAEAAYAGIMARAGGTINYNLFIDDPVAVVYGDADGADSAVGGVSGSLIGNAVVGDRASGTQGSSPLPFGQGFVIANTALSSTLLVSSNLFTQDTQHAKPAITLTMATNTDNPSVPVGLNNVVIENNVLNGWWQGIAVDGRFVPGGTGLYALNNLTVTHNDFINSTTHEVRHDGAFSTAQESWSDNRYYDSVLGQASWISLQGNNLPFGSWVAAYDIGATALAALPYANANRSVATYDGLLGGPGTWQDFLSQADQLSISDYQPQYLAQATINYVDAGFNITSTGISSINAPANPPAATVAAPVVNDSSIGATTYTFTADYVVASALNTGTLDSTNLLITGPNGFSQFATFVSAAAPYIDGNGNQNTVATYSITAPNGAWAVGEDGTYNISLAPNQVFAVSGATAAAGTIGSFTAVLVPPVAIAVAPNLGGSALGTAGNSFTVTYSSAAGINSATLNSNQIQVTGPNGYSQFATLTSTATSAFSNTISCVYTMPAPGGSWAPSANGTYTISLNPGSVADLAGNTVTGGVLTTFTAAVDGSSITAGTASISGSVFNDANGSGIITPRDLPMVGVTMFIDLAGNGVYAAGDPSTVTDQNGNYSFTNLSAGVYNLVETLPAGYGLTTPVNGANSVTLTAGQSATLNFGDQLGAVTINSKTGGGNTQTGTTKTGTRSTHGTTTSTGSTTKVTTTVTTTKAAKGTVTATVKSSL
jgi:hypothetical protein